MDCLSCFETVEDEILYQDNPDSEWKVCVYCVECLNYFKKNQWKSYVDSVKNETCKKSLKSLLKLGPPTKIRDASIPCNNTTKEVYQFKINGELISAQLEGCYEGTQLDEYKKELNELLQSLD